MKELGRLSSEQMKHVMMDASNQSVAALHTKMDELIDAVKALAAKLDTDAVGSADYAATITDAIEKIKLHL